VSARRGTAAETHENHAETVKTALMNGCLPCIVLKVRLQRDLDELPRVSVGAGPATAVGMIRGPNLDRKLPNLTFNLFYVCSQQMPKRMERVYELRHSWSGGCRQIDTSRRYITLLNRNIY
jgi:hypothetical protein